MGIFKRIFRAADERTAFKMVNDIGNGFSAWDGVAFDSDIVRGCIRPYANAIGKLKAQHIRRTDKKIDVNPDPYMRFLLQDPNPYMSACVMQQKIATRLELNNNAFILIVRNENGIPQQLYPIPASSVQTVYNNETLFLKFYYPNGRNGTFPYSDIIHLRMDFNDNDLFGESPYNALKKLLEVQDTTDKGVINAVKNSGIIKWLLQFQTPMRPEDLKKNVQDFVDNYMNLESSTFGAAGVDAKATAHRIEPKDYVPNALIQSNYKTRIYSLFNTNEKIVQSTYSEDEWNSYFEAVIEPMAEQMSQEYSRKLFSRKELSHGNYIYFDAANLTTATINTKLALQAMVDRGALTPNEWRATFNLSPVDGGDEPLRRLDTTTVTQAKNLVRGMNKNNAEDVAEKLLKLLGGEENAKTN